LVQEHTAFQPAGTQVSNEAKISGKAVMPAAFPPGIMIVPDDALDGRIFRQHVLCLRARLGDEGDFPSGRALGNRPDVGKVPDEIAKARSGLKNGGGRR
jgi:hypothetical protein